jgi:hypothetical protein
MFYSCGSMEYMFWSGYCTSKYGLDVAQHDSSIFPYSLTGERRHLLHGSITTYLFLSMGLWLVLRHGLGA